MKSILILLIVVVQCSFAEPITLMTFDVRYGTANGGENSWEYRKEHVVETIRDANPSAIAIQEALREPNEQKMLELLDQRGLEVEYAVIRDAETLLKTIKNKPARALIAAKVRNVRLIDNTSIGCIS